MFKFYSAVIVFSVLVFLLPSCSKFDKEEPIPSYISISSIDLIVPSSLASQQGTASAKISDAWVFIDDQLQGVYELPAKFPVLKEGAHALKIKAGVKQNGIGSTRPIYPFYDEYLVDSNLVKGEIIELKPNVRYRSYTNFVWKEGFESAAVSISKTTNSDTTFEIVSNQLQVFEGQKSFHAVVDESHKVFECKSSNALVLSTNGTPVFLELNYKTSAVFQVGFIANNSISNFTQPVISINPSLDGNNNLIWNKIYINLSDFLSDFYQYTNFNIVFHFENPEGTSVSELYMDNIKLVQ